MLNERKKYSLRKYKVGLFSVLVGAAFAVSTQNGALAAEQNMQRLLLFSTTQSNTTEATPAPEKLSRRKRKTLFNLLHKLKKVEVKAK